MQKTDSISIRLAPLEWELLGQAAARYDKAPSTWVREIAVEAARVLLELEASES